MEVQDVSAKGYHGDSAKPNRKWVAEHLHNETRCLVQLLEKQVKLSQASLGRPECPKTARSLVVGAFELGLMLDTSLRALLVQEAEKGNIAAASLAEKMASGRLAISDLAARCYARPNAAAEAVASCGGLLLVSGVLRRTAKCLSLALRELRDICPRQVLKDRCFLSDLVGRCIKEMDDLVSFPFLHSKLANKHQGIALISMRTMCQDSRARHRQRWASADGAVRLLGELRRVSESGDWDIPLHGLTMAAMAAPLHCAVMSAICEKGALVQSGGLSSVDGRRDTMQTTPCKYQLGGTAGLFTCYPFRAEIRRFLAELDALLARSQPAHSQDGQRARLPSISAPQKTQTTEEDNSRPAVLSTDKTRTNCKQQMKARRPLMPINRNTGSIGTASHVVDEQPTSKQQASRQAQPAPEAVLDEMQVLLDRHASDTLASLGKGKPRKKVRRGCRGAGQSSQPQCADHSGPPRAPKEASRRQGLRLPAQAPRRDSAGNPTGQFIAPECTGPIHNGAKTQMSATSRVFSPSTHTGQDRPLTTQAGRNDLMATISQREEGKSDADDSAPTQLIHVDDGLPLLTAQGAANLLQL